MKLNDRQTCPFQDVTIEKLKSLYPDVFKATAQVPDQRLDEKILKNNFLKLVVSYEDLNHEKITEQQQYTVSRTLRQIHTYWFNKC
jgi:hypothetical protein